MLLPEYGYTPKNFIELVKKTGMKNSEFCINFSMPEQTFYKYKAGTRSMLYKRWENLFNRVKAFLEHDLIVS